MKNAIGAWTILLALVSLLAGQSSNVSEKFLISAKAGGVNAVVGEVTVERPGGRTDRLLKGDEVQIGEKVTTGADGKAEVLMNPGSYVRLGPKSSFEFVSTDLDSVRIRMYSGSAILEVIGSDGFDVELSTDTARFTILQSGVYRIDASEKGSSVVAVWKGKLRAGIDTKSSIGKGKVVEFDGATYTVSKFDRNVKDELSAWSNDRARGLSQVSASLRPNALRNTLINSFYGNKWSFYNSFGLWVFEPRAGSFCFLPFGWGWQSPYGFGFGRPIWYYDLPREIYNQPAPAEYAKRRTVMPVDPTPGSNPRIVANDPESGGAFKVPSRRGPDIGVNSAPRSETVNAPPAAQKRSVRQQP